MDKVRTFIKRALKFALIGTSLAAMGGASVNLSGRCIWTLQRLQPEERLGLAIMWASSWASQNTSKPISLVEFQKDLSTQLAVKQFLIDNPSCCVDRPSSLNPYGDSDTINFMTRVFIGWPAGEVEFKWPNWMMDARNLSVRPQKNFIIFSNCGDVSVYTG